MVAPAVYVMTVDFECCGATYRLPTRLRDGQTLLGQTALTATLLSYAEASHDAEYPECEEPT